MKFLFLFIGLLISFSVFSSTKMLSCELFENGQSLRNATQEIDSNGDASIDLGKQDIYFFQGFVYNGDPVVAIMTVTQEEKLNSDGMISSSQSVTTSTGSILKITCSIN